MIRAARWPQAYIALCSLAGLFGCDRQADTAPPTLHLGEDICAHCRMIVSDARFAAACIVQNDDEYTKRVFDDIGCLIRYEQEHPDDHIVQRYVKDYETTNWTTVQQAFFVHSALIHSPMASGVLAGGTQTEADALAKRYEGQSMDFNAIVDRVRAEAQRRRDDPRAGRQ